MRRSRRAHCVASRGGRSCSNAMSMAPRVSHSSRSGPPSSAPMPDSFEHMPTIAIRMPNGALTSLAGNVDPHHRVGAANLLLVHDRVRETVERLVAEHEPDVVGLSVMTFQRKTAKGLIDLVRPPRPRG